MAGGRGAGILMVLAAGLIYSTAGLFTHALALDAWTVLAWRAVFGTAFTLAWMGASDGWGLLAAFRLSPRDLALAVPMALSSACYILALKTTTVADVTVVWATMPFVTALVAWLWTGEVPDRRLSVASGAGLAGVGWMALGGANDPARLAGMGLTLAMNAGMAVILVNARRGARAGNAVYALGTALSGLLGFALAPREAVGWADVLLLALFGAATLGLAMALYMAGARRIPAAEVGLIGTLDVASGPALAWWALGQAPAPSALAGGAVVMGALLWHLAPDLRALARPG